MDKDKRKLERQKEDEDLLNFDLDDLAFDESEPGPEDEVIELIDLVEKGDLLAGSEEDNLSALLDEEQVEEEKGVPAGPDTDDLSGLEEMLDEADLEKVETGRKGADLEEGIQVDELEKLFEEDQAIGEKGRDEGAMTEDDLERMLVEESAVKMDEEPGEGFSGEEQKPEEGIAIPEMKAAQEIPGLSEEKLTAIVTKAVQDVVERVVRETMAEVAERVFKEAIDALKQSLETTAK